LTPEATESWLIRGLIHSFVERGLLPIRSGPVIDLGCGFRPYEAVVAAATGDPSAYVGLDIPSELYSGADVLWDGLGAPVRDASATAVLLTEVLEHCPDPSLVVAEAFRMLRPGGRLLVTVPFVWPVHNAPWDFQRLTAFSLEALLAGAGFDAITIEPLGGWHAALAQLLLLWSHRAVVRPVPSAIARTATWPLVRALAARDRPQDPRAEGSMMIGLNALAQRPAT
jgi:SAM-dependent methyltransferase